VQTKQFKLTLTRWHKVAERLLKEMTRLDGVCQSKLAGAQFSASARATASAEAVPALAREVEGLMEQHDILNDTLELIRTSLGDANVSEGVARKLGTVDRLNRRMKLRLALIAVEAGKLYTFDDFQGMDVSGFTDGTPRPRGSTDIVKVKVLPNARVIELEAEVEAIRRQINAISDDTSDLNRATLSLSIPVLAAKVAGLDRE
jgi:prefoldin subunit 5